MPAILRIFSYQTDASQSVIGSCQSYGVIVKGTHTKVSTLGSMSVWNIIRCLTLIFWSEISITDVLSIAK